MVEAAIADLDAAYGKDGARSSVLARQALEQEEEEPRLQMMQQALDALGKATELL